MPIQTDPRSNDVPRPQRDRDRQPPSAPRDEPRHFEPQASDDDRNGNDEAINTHGSEK